MLGQGGDGAVYSVWDLVRKHDLALKLMRDTGEPDLRERFEREYGILASSLSARLVRVFDFGQVALRMPDGSMAGHFWYTMEICESNLRRELPNFDLARRVEVGLQMLDGLAFLHAQNIAHRDIKPENTFLVKQTQVKIGDFGLARVSSKAMAAGPGGMGMVMGSPPYLAPERWTGRQDDDWRPSDQYAAGMMIFELLSKGKTALPVGNDLKTCFQAHQSARAYALVIPEIRRRSFPSVDAVIGRMLAKRPEERYSDIAECKRELTAALIQDDVSSEAI
ncbi:MAG: serine/threonine protein kinase [Polyangiaceae bacterium]|nr:serine/threonine protein kinase [Polyangiaceae bacterium]